MNRKDEQELFIARRNIGMVQQQLQQLQQQFQRCDQARATMVMWLLAMLLEHSGGEAIISVPLLQELGKNQYRVDHQALPGNT